MFAAMRSAAAADTCGVAIDVPAIALYPDGSLISCAENGTVESTLQDDAGLHAAAEPPGAEMSM